MFAVRHCPRRCPWQSFFLPNGSRAYRPPPDVVHETDSCGIPIRPPWSVNQLLSSYPTPKMTSATLKRLYELSALMPPEEGTSDHAKMTREMEEMVRLVEAVKLVNTDDVRVADRGEKEDGDRRGYVDQISVEGPDQSGQALLKHAARIADGFYVVDTDRKR